MNEEILETVLQAARSVPASSLPGFIGQLETIRVTALMRLQSQPAPQPVKADRLLTLAETAAMLGCSRSTLYHGGALGLTSKRIGRKVMFSEVEVQKFISNRR